MLASARQLQEALARHLKALDPNRENPNLRQLVVIGHSQGGLLTKMLALDTGNALIRAATGKTLDELDLSQRAKSELRRNCIFEHCPDVTRVIFISTPHRGSVMASSLVRSVTRRIIGLPEELLRTSAEIARTAASLHVNADWRFSPQNTSIDGMSPRNPVLQVLATLPLAPGITGHSIIAVKDAAHPEESSDGVVKYGSAHLEGMASEFIVESGHSCQSNPLVIEEIRRILRLHAEAMEKK